MKRRVMIGMVLIALLVGCGFKPATAVGAAGTAGGIVESQGSVSRFGESAMSKLGFDVIPHCEMGSAFQARTLLQTQGEDDAVIRVLSDDIYSFYNKDDVFYYNNEVPDALLAVADTALFIAKDAATAGVREGEDIHWDVSDSMDGLSLAFTKIYEVNADGSRGNVVVVAEKHGPEQDSLDVDLMAGKTYEVELEIFNDSEVDVLRMIDINLCGSSGDIGFFFIQADMAADTCYWARTHEDQYVQAEEDFMFYTSNNLTITPENVYTLIEDSEEQFIWREIGVRLSTPDDVRAYRLRTAVSIRETSAQTLVFRFAVA